jgi:predicted permease
MSKTLELIIVFIVQVIAVVIGVWFLRWLWGDVGDKTFYCFLFVCMYGALIDIKTVIKNQSK